MKEAGDNRAVSALFRVFGGAGEPVIADAREVPRWRGMHRGEHFAFAALVPLTVLVAVTGPLIRWLGTVGGSLLAVPMALLAIHLLPYVLGGKRAAVQWRLWLAAMLIWAVWRRDWPGVTGVFSYMWIGIGVMNLCAVYVLAWQASMRWSGQAGIAWRMFLLLGLHAGAVLLGFMFGWQWALLAGAGIAAFCCAGILDPSSSLLGDIVCATEDDEILITIDDGPDPHDTPLMLDLLDQHQVKAIFFMIGEKARAHPDLVREVVRRGHGIGNHTLSHPQGSFWCAGPWRTRREIAGCQDILREIAGIAPVWFRAPVGHRNLFTHPIAAVLGLRVMGWNRRGYDAVEKDPAKVLARILPELGKGDIVLLHEATPIAPQVLSGVLQKSHPMERF